MAGKFSKDIKKFTDKATNQMDRFVKDFVQELFYIIVTTTPVDTGFARASWYIAVNDPSIEHTLKTKETDRTIVNWSMYLSASTLNLQNAKIGDRIYLMNNASYIMALEYGHSAQAPQGMVRIALSQVDSIAQEVANRILKT